MIKGHVITNQTRFHKKEYIKGEIDYFVHFDLGTLRDVSKKYYDQINEEEFHQLITHKYHEYRMVALLILMNQMNQRLYTSL